MQPNVISNRHQHLQKTPSSCIEDKTTHTTTQNTALDAGQTIPHKDSWGMVNASQTQTQ